MPKRGRTEAEWQALLDAERARVAELEQQRAATDEILKVIRHSPTELQRVMDTLVESAARLCDAPSATVERFDRQSGTQQILAWKAPSDRKDALLREIAPDGHERAPTVSMVGTSSARAFAERRTLHVLDMAEAVESEFPGSARVQRLYGQRTEVAVPILRQGEPIGILCLHRFEVKPFTPSQIALIETFADQAAIAIENARLFQELNDSNGSLREALAQQTATADVLRVISRSPTAVEPVLEQIVRTAAALCGALNAACWLVEGETIRLGAAHGPAMVDPDHPLLQRHPLVRGGGLAEDAIFGRRTVQVADMQEETERFPHTAAGARRAGFRTLLAVPLLRGDEAVGALWLSRVEAELFSDDQVRLIESFADQAVIAMENARLFAELQERLEEQEVTAHVLRVMSQSPTDLPAVLSALVEAVATLCDAEDVVVGRTQGDSTELIAEHGPLAAEMRALVEELNGSRNLPLSRGLTIGRATLDGTVVRVADLATDPDFPAARVFAERTGVRSSLAVPLRRDRAVLGAIAVYRREVRPFDERQMTLLSSFADQAVIAIENARLFSELNESNASLRESLEQQTATAEVLRVISESPTDLQRVLGAIVQSAARLTEATDARIFGLKDGMMHGLAGTGAAAAAVLRAEPDFPAEPGRVSGRAVVERRTVHVPDLMAVLDEYPSAAEIVRQRPDLAWRAAIAVPLLREGEPIGGLIVTRQVPGPFADGHVFLIESFADQAVIAIENARLFQELNDSNASLKEALEQQTATTDVLRIISRSPTEPQAALDAILERAARLCGASDARIFRREDGRLRSVAGFGVVGAEHHRRRVTEGQAPPLTPDSVQGRATLEARTVHVEDIVGADDEYAPQAEFGRRHGVRTHLAVPLLREGAAIGSFLLARDRVEAFSPEAIALVESFADQAAIAIENARLFSELQERLEEQTATTEVLRVIASSPTDQGAVLNEIAWAAARLCGAPTAAIQQLQGEFLVGVGRYFASEEHAARSRQVAERRRARGEPGRRATRGSVSGRAYLDRRTISVDDHADEATLAEFSDAREAVELVGIRSHAATPLLRRGEPIGVLFVIHHEVKPFTDRQLRLLESFADQAVIAIENARLFQELNESNAGLHEALEQQTATSQVLQLVSRSAFDLQAVLDTLVENAAKLCGARLLSIFRYDGEVARHAAWLAGTDPALVEALDRNPIRPGRSTATGRAMLERRVVQVEDVRADLEYAHPSADFGTRTILAVPLLRDGELVGVIVAAKYEVAPFTDRQIALLQTFADQAVIAMENTRLVTELQERLEEQTATAAVLQVISRSAFALQAVLDALAENAARLCGASIGMIFRADGDAFSLAAHHGVPSDAVAVMQANPIRPGPQTATGRALLLRRPVHIHDALADPDYTYPMQEALGYRTLLAVPLVREDVAVGTFTIWRTRVEPFTERQILLLQTFADQAAIAIENARLVQELRSTSEQLAEASRHKSEFLANMSHELRTPLNAIIGFSEVLLERYFGEINAKQEEYLRDVLSSGQHLLSLINDILDLSKVEAGRMELELSTFDVEHALQGGLVMLKERAQKNGVQLGLAVDPSTGRVEADERKVKQVVFNLLSNAVKFTPSGGRVDVNAWRERGRVYVAVRDTGVGIAPEEQAKVFEEFGQARSGKGQAEGTGLGLTLVKRFVELHGGDVTLESELGKGSTFTVSLPVRPPARSTGGPAPGTHAR